MKKLGLGILLFALGALLGFVICPRQHESNPGHANTTLIFAVAQAEEMGIGGPLLLERLLAIDVRYVGAELKAAFYGYVAALQQEVQAKNSGADISALKKQTAEARARFLEADK
jgi:hypothetical protein